MKKKITIISLISILAVALIASDHIDAPSVINQSSDIADLYAFQGENTDNLTFIVTTQGVLSPVSSETANFDQNVVLQINIDTNKDNIEDLVIQAVRRGDFMWFFGPEKPAVTGKEIQILENATIKGRVTITPYLEDQITLNSQEGLKYFAGITDDPFFFDIQTFLEIRDGRASSFNNPGNDTWNGLNVLSAVVEVPKSLLGDSSTINVWASSHRKQ